MKNTAILSIVLSLFFTVNVQSQEFRQHKNVIEFPSVTDLGISPLKYRGIGYGFGSGYYFIHPEYIVDIKFEASLAGIFVFTDSLELKSTCIFTKFRNEFSIFRKLPINFYNLKQYIGIASLTDLNFRTYPHLGNSSVSYDMLNSVALSGITARDFAYKQRDFALSFFWSVPLLTTAVRPNYIHLLNFTYPDFDMLTDFMDNSEIGSIFKFPRLKIKLSLTYKPKTGNMFEFYYSSDTYVLNTINPVLSKNNSFGLIAFLKLR